MFMHLSGVGNKAEGGRWSLSRQPMASLMKLLPVAAVLVCGGQALGLAWGSAMPVLHIQVSLIDSKPVDKQLMLWDERWWMLLNQPHLVPTTGQLAAFGL